MFVKYEVLSLFERLQRNKNKFLEIHSLKAKMFVKYEVLSVFRTMSWVGREAVCQKLFTLNSVCQYNVPSFRASYTCTNSNVKGALFLDDLK